MTKATYTKEPRNARSISRAVSWLRACGIACRTHNGGLVVNKKTGGEIHVNVSFDGDKSFGNVVVSAEDLASPKVGIAMSAFHSISKPAGYGTPTPLSRGAWPKCKLYPKDNFELVAFRHKDFRRVPNPDPSELDSYTPMLKKICNSFYKHNKDLCLKGQCFRDDLLSYAQVWTCTYIGFYKVTDGSSLDNIRKLKVFLRQRFSEFRNVLQRKTQNCIPLISSIPYPDLDEEDEIDNKYIKMHNELNCDTPQSRRKSAADLLNKLLNDLPHDEMLTLLDNAANNELYCSDVRSEAKRQFKKRAICN